MFDTVESFCDHLLVETPSVHRISGDYYIIPERLLPFRSVLEERQRGIGLRAGSNTSSGFKPSPALLRHVYNGENKVVVNEKGAEQFCYGNAVNEPTVLEDDRDAEIYFVCDSSDDCLGIAAGDEHRPLVDIGTYVRDRA